jgi:hypothetical protein
MLGTGLTTTREIYHKIGIFYNVPKSYFLSKLLLFIDLPPDCLHDVLVALSRMRNGAGRAVLHIVFESKIAAAIEQVKRAPAEQAGLPLIQFVARIEGAVLVDEIFVVHGTTSPWLTY